MEALVLVLLTAAVGLAVLEAAVPGLGVAGVGATACGIGAAVVVWRAEVPWWPLVAVALATVLWTLMVGWPRPPVGAQVTAAGLHAAGGVAFGVVADDLASVVVAVVGAAGLAVAFPGLHRWTRGIADQPPRTGMEALVGRVAVVEGVPGGRLVVRLDGSLWSISADPGAPVAAGAPVVVRGWRGVVLAVEPVAPGAGIPSAPS